MYEAYRSWGEMKDTYFLGFFLEVTVLLHLLIIGFLISGKERAGVFLERTGIFPAASNSCFQTRYYLRERPLSFLCKDRYFTP